MSEYVIYVDENDERWHYVEQRYTHFFGYPITTKIVRCRDCVYFDKYENDEISVCHRFDNEQPIVEPDGFCAWAKGRI